MIATIIIVSLALIWLAKETDWLRIRLESTEYQRANKRVNITETIKQNPVDTPYYWQSPEAKEQHIIICHNDWRCPYRKQCQKVDRWTGWKLPARTIKAFDSTLNLAEGCNIKRALFLKSLAREITRKSPAYQPPLFKHEFIYQARVGSHHEYVRWDNEANELDIRTRPKKGYSHRVVEDYTTKYLDCLVPKTWLKAHADDRLPEPVIDISVDGKSISVNGNYKKGIIKEFMKVNHLSKRQRLAYA